MACYAGTSVAGLTRIQSAAQVLRDLASQLQPAGPPEAGSSVERLTQLREAFPRKRRGFPTRLCELFTGSHGHAVIYRPASEPSARGRVRPVTLLAAELAITVHHGPHSDLDISYGRLGAYVAGHALAIAGPVREAYLVGPADTADEELWRTEIGWPIFRVSHVPEATA